MSYTCLIWTRLCIRLRSCAVSLREAGCRRLALIIFVLCAALSSISAVAVDLSPGDILVLDTGGSKLLRVDPVNGNRTVISDFADTSQGPTSTTVIGLAVGALGNIYLSDILGPVFVVNPENGRRFVVTNFQEGRLTGFLANGLAVEPLGSLLVNLQSATPVQYVARFIPVLNARSLVTDFSNPNQGGDLSCCNISDFTLDNFGTIIAAETNFFGAQSAIYRINPLTGVRQIVSDFSNQAQGADVVDLFFSTGVAIESSGNILINSGGSIYAPRNLLLRVHPVTGVRTVLSDFDDAAKGVRGSSLHGIAIEKTGKIVIAASSIGQSDAAAIYRVHHQTGNRVLISDSTNPGQGPAIISANQIAVVPNAVLFLAPPNGVHINPFGLNK